MSSINKTSVLSQFSSALSALNVSTETSEDLLLYLKSAINAEVSAATIISELTSRIEAIADSSTLQNLLILTVATSLITDDRSITISDLSTLAGVTNAAAGTVVFVDDANIPYIQKSNGTWVPIDPSLQNPALPNAYAWGFNASGQIGDGTAVSNSSPVSVVGFSDWIQVSAGDEHSLGLEANGTAWGWGENRYGRLGDGTAVDTSLPVAVVGGFADWIQLSAGSYHSLGVKTNGTAWAWGQNALGKLGDGTTANRSSPVSVVGGFVDWVQLSAGKFHSLGLRANGTAWGWGGNSKGALGDGSPNPFLPTSDPSPVSVVGGFTDWIQVSAGGLHSLGLRANGTAWAWGYNSSGQLGTAAGGNARSPVAVVGGFTDWINVSANKNNGMFDGRSFGIRTNGTAWAWGSNSYGRLADGTTTDRSSPVSVVGGFTDWVSVEAGLDHCLAIRTNGTAWAWGSNTSGRLGTGNATDQSSPVSVVGGFADWVQVSGGAHSLGIRGR